MEEKKTLKDYAKSACEAAKERANKFKDWCKKNKEAVIVFGPIFIGSAMELIKVVNRRNTITEEKRLKENYIYDAKHHHYYELKRQPKACEWCLIDACKDSGADLYDVLDSLRLLK